MGPLDAGSPDFARVIALSDGLFAFSLTLLAVNIMPAASDVPRLTQDLAGFLWEMRRQLVIYALTFVIVVAKWNGHRRLVDAIDRYDHRFLQLNMLLLLFIAAMPFPAYIIGTQGGQLAAVVLFAGYQMVTTLIVLSMWLYATRQRRLIRADLPVGWIRVNLTRMWLMVLIFAGSIPLAWYSVGVAEYSWLLLIGVRPLADWLTQFSQRPSVSLSKRTSIGLATKSSMPAEKQHSRSSS